MEKIIWIEEYLEEAQRLCLDEGHEPAIKLLNRLLYEEPGYYRLHYVLGYLYFYEVENMAQAEIHFKLAIKFEPLYAESYWHLGLLLRDEERFDEAIAVCASGLKAKRSNKSGLLQCAGKAYELKKKYAKAIRHYREALSHSVDFWNCRVLEQSIKRCKRKQK